MHQVQFESIKGVDLDTALRTFFTDNYDHQMIENGVLLKKIVYLKRNIPKTKS